MPKHGHTKKNWQNSRDARSKEIQPMDWGHCPDPDCSETHLQDPQQSYTGGPRPQSHAGSAASG